MCSFVTFFHLKVERHFFGVVFYYVKAYIKLTLAKCRSVEKILAVTHGRWTAWAQGCSFSATWTYLLCSGVRLGSQRAPVGLPFLGHVAHPVSLGPLIPSLCSIGLKGVDPHLLGGKNNRGLVVSVRVCIQCFCHPLSDGEEDKIPRETD